MSYNYIYNIEHRPLITQATFYVHIWFRVSFIVCEHCDVDAPCFQPTREG
jgi:hypothetical protein